MFVSVTLPIDRAMPYFRVVAGIFSVLTLTTIGGIVYYLSKTGFIMNEMEYNPATQHYQDVVPVVQHFNVLTVAGIIMLVVYLMPFIMRPLDFIDNASSYIVGLISYLILMPMFINVFSIYSMCNLHDVSWGNRPTSTGQEAFTDNKKEQEKAKGDYQVFRTNFTLFWLFLNGVYYVFVMHLAESLGPKSGENINTGKMGYFEYFSLYLAWLVVFRIFFATFYVLGMKLRYCCSKKYKTKRLNLEAEFKKVKSKSKDGYSTDDEVIEEKLNRIFQDNEPNIAKNAAEGVDAHEATMEFMCQESNAHEDSDDDNREFLDATVEEAEDRLRNAYRRNKYA
jgi:hypothetical protein